MGLMPFMAEDKCLPWGEKTSSAEIQQKSKNIRVWQIRTKKKA